MPPSASAVLGKRGIAQLALLGVHHADSHVIELFYRLKNARARSKFLSGKAWHANCTGTLTTSPKKTPLDFLVFFFLRDLCNLITKVSIFNVPVNGQHTHRTEYFAENAIAWP